MRAWDGLGVAILVGFSSLRQRKGMAAVIVFGMAGVVAVFVSVLAMAQGLNSAVGHTGRADRVIIFQSGAKSELGSYITPVAAQRIIVAPGIKRTVDGVPIASVESVVLISVKKRDMDPANITLRGVGAQAFVLRPEMKIVAGRSFERGVRELIVGKAAQHQFHGLEIGDSVRIHNSDWKIVGAFESGGDAHESEMIADADVVLSAYQRSRYQTITALLESPESFMTFKDALTVDPTLTLDIKSEQAHYAKQSEDMSRVLFFTAYVIGAIMAVGALFSALNTMYAAVSARARELATLRAIGFGAAPVVGSILLEAMLLAVTGGVLGACFVSFFLNQATVNMLSDNSVQIVFRLPFTVDLALMGIGLAVLVGMVGGLFPALWAAHQPIAIALRKT